MTDSAGRFVLHAPGPYTIRADPRGFATLFSPTVTLEREQAIEMELRVSQHVSQLPPVTVVGDSTPFAPGPLRGFWERKWRGWARFLTREDIERIGSPHTTTLISTLPDLRLVKPSLLGQCSILSTVRRLQVGASALL